MAVAFVNKLSTVCVTAFPLYYVDGVDMGSFKYVHSVWSLKGAKTNKFYVLAR